MNSMANHGYLPRDGRGVTADIIVDALMECFRLSKPLAWALTHGALLLLDQGSAPFELHDLARHNKVEHDASLYHPNAGEREEYAPIHGDVELLREFFETSKDGRVMTPEDVARVRARRETATPLDFVHAELARGEVAIVLNMFNNPDPALHTAGVPLQPRNALVRVARSLVGQKDTGANRQLDGVPIERMRYWFEHERLPPDWKPYHTTTLRETISTINRLRSAMSGMRKEAKAEAQVPRVEVAPQVQEPQAAVAVAVEGSEEEVKARAKDDKDARVSTEEELSTDDENFEGSQILSVPPLMHSKSASSATSDTFTESVLHTPQASEFTTSPFVVKGGAEPSIGIGTVVGKQRIEGEEAIRVVVVEA